MNKRLVTLAVVASSGLIGCAAPVEGPSGFRPPCDCPPDSAILTVPVNVATQGGGGCIATMPDAQKTLTMPRGKRHIVIRWEFDAQTPANYRFDSISITPLDDQFEQPGPIRRGRAFQVTDINDTSLLYTYTLKVVATGSNVSCLVDPFIQNN